MPASRMFSRNEQKLSMLPPHWRRQGHSCYVWGETKPRDQNHICFIFEFTMGLREHQDGTNIWSFRKCKMRESEDRIAIPHVSVLESHNATKNTSGWDSYIVSLPNIANEKTQLAGTPNTRETDTDRNIICGLYRNLTWKGTHIYRDEPGSKLHVSLPLSLKQDNTAGRESFLSGI